MARVVNVITGSPTSAAYHLRRGSQRFCTSYPTALHILLQRALAGMANTSPPGRRVEPLTWFRLLEVLRILPSKVAQFVASLDRAAFLRAYSASLRVGEFAKSASTEHTLRLGEVSFAENQSSVTLTLSSYKHSKRPAKLVLPASTERAHGVCPVEALKVYLSVRPKGEGVLFRHRNGSGLNRSQVASILKTCAEAVGLDPKDYDTHSFRAGRTTDLVEAGYSDGIIRESGRWSSDAYLKYVRFDLFKVPRGLGDQSCGVGGLPADVGLGVVCDPTPRSN